MNRLSAIDAPVALGDLLGPDDLGEVVVSFAALHGVGLTLLDRDGRVLARAGVPDALAEAAAAGDEEAGGVRWCRATLEGGGDEVGVVVVGPYVAAGQGEGIPALEEGRARALCDHVTRLFGVLVHNAMARYLTATVHVAAMDEAFAELSEKNARLAEAIERMQEVDRLKSNFLATVSHELRTPLTSVIGYSEMLLEGLAGALNGEQRDYVRTILGKADQLLQLITGILDVSMIESGTLRIQREPVPVAEIVDNVVAGFAARAQTRGLRIVTPTTSVPRALGDSRKIRQILWNLIANAIKFTPEGGEVAVDVRVGPLAPDGDGGQDGVSLPARPALGLRVEVRDSGIGISPEKQARIFEPFFQVDSSSTREYGGTGLGLTLAKSYVEAHGGHIWVDSELGVGSVFTVSLPAVPEELEAHQAGGGGGQTRPWTR